MPRPSGDPAHPIGGYRKPNTTSGSTVFIVCALLIILLFVGLPVFIWAGAWMTHGMRSILGGWSQFWVDRMP